MAPMLFTKSILEDQAIKVFNNGKMERDFTYVNDIVEGLKRITFVLPEKDLNGNQVRIANIRNVNPIQLVDFISALEECLEKESRKEFLPMQEGDIYSAYADRSELKEELEYNPKVSVKEGVTHFVEWFKNFYKN